MQIYKITNNINGKIYVGMNSTSNDNYMGSGSILNTAKKKYGLENFTKEILEDNIKTIEELVIKEVYWINKLNSRNRSIGYNITPGGIGNTGKWNGNTLTEDHKNKISNSMIGRKITWCEKLSKARQNSKKVNDLFKSEEWRKKISNTMTGVSKSREHRDNLSKSIKESKAHKEATSSKEFKQKCSNWQKNKKRSDEYQKKWLETKQINTLKKQEIDKIKVLNALNKNKWDINKTADYLKCHKNTINKKIKKYNLNE